MSVAPYDMISVFGTNFCPNCTSTQVLTGSPDPVSSTYPTQLQFNSTTNNLSVTFQAHSGSISGLPVNAPMLFATNSQINLLVPSVVPTGTGNVDIVVNYGPTGSLRTSAAFTVSVVAIDPGIFTIGADGQGSGAALDLNYELIGATNPAGIRTGSGNSDTIALYVTGLGAPDGSATNASGGTNTYSTDCVSLSNYLTAFNGAQTGTALTSLDGTLILPSVIDSSRLIPCLAAADITHLYVGGVDVASGLQYVGWVPGTIAGLYQMNIKMPIDNVSGRLHHLFRQRADEPERCATSTTPGPDCYGEWPKPGGRQPLGGATSDYGRPHQRYGLCCQHRGREGRCLSCQ